MPLMMVRTALAASGTATPWSGQQYEILTFDAFVEVGLTADATGVLATIYSGPDLLYQEGPIFNVRAINQPPVYPDDYSLSDEAAAGDRLSCLLRDTSAVARVVFAAARIAPI